MRLSTVRITDDRVTSAARQDGDELVLLPYADVGALLATGDDWHERAASADGERLPLAESSLAPLVPHPTHSLAAHRSFGTKGRRHRN